LGCSSLNLQFSNIGPEKLNEMIKTHFSNGRIAALRGVDISHSELGCLGARHLATALISSRNLTILSARHNQIGEEGARALGRLLGGSHSLRELDLRSNPIGDIGARVLAAALMGHPSLVTLDLRSNGIGKHGARALAGALKKNTVIRKLLLEGNEVGDEGAASIAAMLRRNQDLEHLDLARNGIGEDGAAALEEALGENEGLQSLDLQYNTMQLATIDRVLVKLQQRRPPNVLTSSDSEARSRNDINGKCTSAITEADLDQSGYEYTGDDSLDAFEKGRLELLALENKEIAFKRTVERETAEAELAAEAAWKPLSGNNVETKKEMTQEELQTMLQRMSTKVENTLQPANNQNQMPFRVG